jgi:hypothetical protein
MPNLLVIVIFGLIAAGKTTLSRSLHQATGWPVIHSDEVRKNLVGIPPTSRVTEAYGAGIYSPEFSQLTYREMLRQAGHHLEQGRNVILEASYKSAADRAQARQLAQEVGASVAFIHCTCSDAEVARRLDKRQANHQAISDGRKELLAPQKQEFDPLDDLKDVPLLVIDTGQDKAIVQSQLEAFLKTLTPKWMATPCGSPP